MINLNFNHVEQNIAPPVSNEPIPDGTIARAVCNVKLNDNPIPNEDQCIFQSQNENKSIYMELCWTIIDGEYAGRRIWVKWYWTEKTLQFTKAKIRRLIEENYGLNPDDTSPESVNARNLKHLSMIDQMEGCLRFGIEKGQKKADGTFYKDKNNVFVMTMKDRGFIQRKSPPKPMPVIEKPTLVPQPESKPLEGLTPAEQLDQIQDDIPF